MRMFKNTRLLGSVVAMLLFAGTALAFTAVEQNADIEIHLASYDLHNYRSFASEQGIAALQADLRSLHSADWQVWSWNARTQTPHYVFGSPINKRATLGNAQDAEAAARQVIAEHPSVFRADNSDLRLTAAEHARGKWALHFQQTRMGIDVMGGKAVVLFGDSGSLLLMGSDFYSDIDLSHAPTLSKDEAEEMARDALPFIASTDRLDGDSELLILPVPLSEEAVEHHLVWRVRVRTEQPLGIWVSDVDAQSGEILQRRNDIHFAYSGDTEIGSQVYGWCDGVSTSSIPYLDINVGGLGTVTSDENGNWFLAGSGGDLTVTADLDGPYVFVTNFDGSEASFSATASEGIPLTVDFNSGNARQDERDTFDAVNDIHDFFQLFAPEFGYANQRMHAVINRDDGYCPCNAWWDGTINFCAAGGSCANTGELQQVVHHEFGHGVQAAILGYQGDEGLGEGNGDILGNLMTQDPIIGRGFYSGNCVSGIRNSDNNLSYPGDVVGEEIHYAGQVIAGFNWDAMVDLQTLYDSGPPAWNSPGTLVSASNWHYGRVLGHPETQPDQVLWTFIADDDDEDILNGTVHGDIYCDAAENHGFDCPIPAGIVFVHTPLDDTTDSDNAYLVNAVIWSVEGNIDPATVKLRYRFEGGLWSETAMTDLGGGSFEAGIPPTSGGRVDYYLYAEDDLGTVGLLPDDAPVEPFSFLVAWAIDPAEITGDWEVGEIFDTATGGEWNRMNPYGTSAQPEDDHTSDGTDCWVTDGRSGSSDGTYDVDGGKTTLFTPVYDLTGASSVSLRYWKWYSNDQGPTNNGEDWWRTYFSNDGGSSWTALEATQNSSNAWVSVLFDLNDWVNDFGELQIKFVAEDAGEGASLVEAAIDDLSITALFGTGVDDDFVLSVPLRLEQNAPNPFNPRTEIAFALKSEGRVDLSVFEVSGRLVKNLAAGQWAAGEHRVIWDGRDDQGKPVGSGVYFYRLATAEGNKTRQMVLIK